ncbi:glycosyltransferase family 2 protein [Roseovarius salinarum]|uniref:glycosyltransferase family 2 protein n=1 Tax=Roseovarius salinarum TaxID=1981892 RepID=UPI000C34A55B|nr:glycosyltransferase family 2 protein [Roseovarius salinarum]
MNRPPTWGLVATVKADTRTILDFAAHHVDLGAHRVHVYLDADDPAARAALKAHPKCRVTLCDAPYWQGLGGRPKKHQVRQTANATRCLRRGPEVDWLVHIDVDEFLWPEAPLPEQLAALPAATLSARVRPVEALAPDPAAPDDPVTWCKGFSIDRPRRRAQTDAIYPTYGEHLDGGFLSHVAGKVFVRTDSAGDEVTLRIHNAIRDGKPDPDCAELPRTRLAHVHAPDIDSFLRHYAFRMEKGAYRPGLKPAPRPDGAGLTMNQLLGAIEESGGEAALRAFFEEVCTATPALCARLDDHGLLHALRLDLDAKRARHFPGAA